jgi:dTDP-4-dehydrorhamnose reductase
MQSAYHLGSAASSELGRYKALRDQLLEQLPDLDEQTLADTLEGITDLRELLAELVRSALEDEALSAGLATRLAEAILAISERLAGAQPAQPWGIYHATSAGETTWAGFAAAIVEEGAQRLGVPRVPVIPIATREYPTPARRPANSCLDCSKLQRVFDLRLPPWQQGVEQCVAELGRGAQPPT